MKTTFAYLITGDNTWFTRNSNAYQKMRLVTGDLRGRLVLPQGCERWVHPEYRDYIETYRYPRWLCRGIFLKLFVPIQMLAGVYANRKNVSVWMMAPSNELTFLACWFIEAFSRITVVLFCWDPPGVSVRDRTSIVARIRCWMMDRLMAKAVTCSRLLVLNLERGFLGSRLSGTALEKIRCYPNGTLVSENARIVSGIAYVANRIAVNSRFESEKGCFEMARLFVSLRKKIPDASLVWTGDGGDRQAVLDYLRDNGVPAGEGGVTAPGRIPHRDALRLLATAQVAVNCYEDVPSLRWNHVLKLPEFQSIGVPVVTVDLPGVRAYVKDGETGILFPAGGWKDAQTAIERLLKDPDKCHSIALRASESVSRFEWMSINALIADQIMRRTL